MNPTPMTVRQAAYSATAKALHQGKIIKPKCCSKCRKKKVVYAHHPDYGAPLTVEWLCGSCHKKVHIEAGEVNSRIKGGGVLRLKA